MSTNKRSEAQRRADATYRARHRPLSFAVSYDTDRDEGLRLRAYVASVPGLSINRYIKGLIKADLDARGYPYPDQDNDQARS